MKTTIDTDRILGSLFQRRNVAQLHRWIAQHGGCLMLIDLEDERARRGFGARS